METIEKLKLLKEKLCEQEKVEKPASKEKPKIKKIGTLKDGRRLFEKSQS
ncbi:MAG: hypothetical protein IKG27_01995 [Bacilli bacterium]|nr:hypothetical protein [Bacilli bacterium]